MIHSINLAYSLGIIYVYFLDEFGESKAYTSLILSLFSGLGPILGLFANRFFLWFKCFSLIETKRRIGPISSFLVKRYGCRLAEIGAAILCVVCYFGSSFATNVFTLIVTIGKYESNVTLSMKSNKIKIFRS